MTYWKLATVALIGLLMPRSISRRGARPLSPATPDATAANNKQHIGNKHDNQ